MIQTGHMVELMKDDVNVPHDNAADVDLDLSSSWPARLMH
jgi:hypothetical protein